MSAPPSGPIGRDALPVRAVAFSSGGFDTALQLGVVHAILTIQFRRTLLRLRRGIRMIWLPPAIPLLVYVVPAISGRLSPTSSPTTAQLQDTAWSYRIAVTIRSPLGDSGFVRVRAVAADSLGHLFIADQEGLYLADSLGKAAVRIARRGRGPGEVMWVTGLVGLRTGGVWVIDYGNRRYSRFAADGRFLTSKPRKLSGYFVPWPGGAWRDGFIEFTQERTQTKLQVVAVITDSDWEFRARLALPSAEEVHVPFAAEFVFRSATSSIWFGLNDRYRIHNVTVTGHTVAVVTHNRAAQRVTAEEREDALAGLRARLGQMPTGGTHGTRVDLPMLPARKPFFSSLVPLGDGGLLVIPILAASDQNRVLDFFDRTGRFRGTVQLPYPLVTGVAPVVLGQQLFAVLEVADGEHRIHILRLQH
jgi:hypothetical protein